MDWKWNQSRCHRTAERNKSKAKRKHTKRDREVEQRRVKNAQSHSACEWTKVLVGIQQWRNVAVTRGVGHGKEENTRYALVREEKDQWIKTAVGRLRQVLERIERHFGLLHPEEHQCRHFSRFFEIYYFQNVSREQFLRKNGSLLATMQESWRLIQK